jgi:hypothetical protein
MSDSQPKEPQMASDPTPDQTRRSAATVVGGRPSGWLRSLRLETPAPRKERLSRLPGVQRVRRWLVGDDAEGELRTVSMVTIKEQYPAPATLGPTVLGGAFLGTALGFKGWGMIAGAVVGLVANQLLFRSAVPNYPSDLNRGEGPPRARDLEEGNWLQVRSRGLVGRVARVTSLEDVGLSVRVTLSNGQAMEWPWARRVNLVALRLPVPPSWGPKGRCIYAVAHEELPAAWDLQGCGAPATAEARSPGGGLLSLCDDHSRWARAASPGLRVWPIADEASSVE